MFQIGREWSSQSAAVKWRLFEPRFFLAWIRLECQSKLQDPRPIRPPIPVTIMADFVTSNKPDWEELEKILARSRRTVRRLKPEEVQRLDVLYRRVTVHLAQVRTRTRDVRLAIYLNHLAAAAHSVIYLPPKKRVLTKVGIFVAHGFAQTIFRNRRFHLVSGALLVAGALVAYHASTRDVLATYALLPAGEMRTPGMTKDQLQEFLRHGRDNERGLKFFFASFLFANNLKVGLFATCLGIVAGVPTILLILYNGMILGSFLAVHIQAGVGLETWAWILPHGITEIGAIVLCGGVGLMLGSAVVSPGLKTRAESLVDAGREAILTLIGVAGMLTFAAFVESYVRQSDLSTSGRLAYAAGTAIFWILYIVYGSIYERDVK